LATKSVIVMLDLVPIPKRTRGQVDELLEPHFRLQLRQESCSHKRKYCFLILWFLTPVHPVKWVRFFEIRVSYLQTTVHGQPRECKVPAFNFAYWTVHLVNIYVKTNKCNNYYSIY
jgi:hypothetical protein